VRGRYRPCTFCELTADQQEFVRLFLERRGNLREVEKALGVSYPTVRGKLEEIAARLAGPGTQAASAAPTGPIADAAERQEVLRQVAAGTLSVSEGLARLRASRADAADALPPAD
jgi:hypothetical protein